MHSGEVFGMLNCGDRRKGKINSSCIFDIFKDIKDLTGAAEVFCLSEFFLKVI
ncbi:unnamed protein product [Penicillium roqueforti FM164]|uniref:Uncharacterized protein n=1 Tax=Penicillium roqueforti (strain FM164) TaxID=1365484 RepID=W6R7V0_PENRF|nr:unnamed protein product [Penicillium roqueforti FM164]